MDKRNVELLAGPLRDAAVAAEHDDLVPGVQELVRARH